MTLNKIGSKELQVKKYASGFELAHDTYNAVSCASDGRIYYVLSSESIDEGGKVYVYDPATDQTKFLADLTEICGEAGRKAIPQGKSHVRFYEYAGKLYFATHVGYYEMIDGIERLPENPPEGYKLYPGGHIVSYDLETGEFEDLAIAPEGDGIITMTLDKDRGQIYGLSWPKGKFLHYDIAASTLRDFGQTCANGEAGIPGDDYRVICRSMFVDDVSGYVYFSIATGDLMVYKPGAAVPEILADVNMRLDYFGKFDYTRPGSMGYNWRKIFWYAPDGVAYGVHGNSGYLFRFDPRSRAIELVDRITSAASRKSGMFDQFSYGYMGLILGPDDTIYYLTGSPVYENGKRLEGAAQIAKGGSRGIENLHLITYNIPFSTYADHGSVFLEDGTRPSYVNSIAIDKTGAVYALARFEKDGGKMVDLLKIVMD